MSLEAWSTEPSSGESYMSPKTSMESGEFHSRLRKDVRVYTSLKFGGQGTFGQARRRKVPSVPCVTLHDVRWCRQNPNLCLSRYALIPTERMLSMWQHCLFSVNSLVVRGGKIILSIARALVDDEEDEGWKKLAVEPKNMNGRLWVVRTRQGLAPYL